MEVILFVCTGNTCRSPMAEALFKDLLSQQQEYKVLSAGVAANKGAKANEKAVLALAKEGVDLKDHQARVIDNDLIKQADLILTMTERHKSLIFNLNSKAESKTYTLKEYANLDNLAEIELLDISDPFGQALTVYQKCAKEIRVELEKIVKKYL